MFKKYKKDPFIIAFFFLTLLVLKIFFIEIYSFWQYFELYMKMKKRENKKRDKFVT